MHATWKLWLAGTRPRTLPASIAPVIVGAASAWGVFTHRGGWGLHCIDTTSEAPTALGQPCDVWWYTIDGAIPRFLGMTFLCIGVALFLQIAVNFANDYSDGIRGVDEGRSVPESHTANGHQTGSSFPARSAAVSATAQLSPTQPTPAQPVTKVTKATKVTKPQRLVASGVPPKQVLAAAGIAAALACTCGLAVSIISGQYWLIALGALCLLAGWFYTGGHHPYGYAGFGEVSVFVFFGLVATLGTEFVICQSFDGFGIPNVTRFDFAQPFADGWNGWTWFWQGQFGIDLTGLVAAVCCGLNAVLLLMVNNVRDITEDKQHGKRTLAVRLGERGARIALVVCLALDVLLVAILVTVLWFPWGMILLLSSLAVPVRIVRSIARHDFRWALADAGYWNLFFPILFVICMGASGIGL